MEDSLRWREKIFMIGRKEPPAFELITVSRYLLGSCQIHETGCSVQISTLIAESICILEYIHKFIPQKAKLHN
jgi:hypothetical protein